MYYSKLIEQLNEMHAVSPDYQSLIRSGQVYRQRTIKRRIPILMPGREADELHFVGEGLFKLYQLDENEDEIILAFFTALGFIMMPNAFYDGGKNESYYIMPITDGILLTTDRSIMKGLYKDFSEVRTHTDMVRSRLTDMEHLHRSILFHPPIERFALFLQKFKHLQGLLSEADICAFLGISLSTLDRSKQEIREEEKKRKQVFS